MAKPTDLIAILQLIRADIQRARSEMGEQWDPFLEDLRGVLNRLMHTDVESQRFHFVDTLGQEISDIVAKYHYPQKVLKDAASLCRTRGITPPVEQLPSTLQERLYVQHMYIRAFRETIRALLDASEAYRGKEEQDEHDLPRQRS